MSFDHLPRIYTVDKRIVESERFFRIEEAEARAAKNREALEERIAAKLRRREKGKKEGSLSPEKAGLLPDVRPQQFFSAHVLNRDPEVAKFLDYSELIYPKPYNVLEGTGGIEDMPPDFMDKMWISGFLDRANRDANAIAKAEAIKRAQEMAKKQRGKGKGLKSKLAAAAAAAAATEEENTGGPTFPPHPTAIAIGKFGPLKASMNHLGDQVSTISQDISNIESHMSVASSHSSVSTAQQLFFADLEREAQAKEKAEEARRRAAMKKKSEKKHIVTMMKPYADSVTDYLLKKQSGNWLPKPSDKKSENEAKEDQLAGKEGDEIEATFASFYSVDLDRIFDKERQEHEAAIVIQKWWKKFSRLVPWLYAVKCMTAAARIQRLVRGAIVRKWVAKWYNSRNKVITKVQANIRRMLSNIKTKPRLALEQVKAVEIQRIIRGKIGRLKWLRKRWNIAALHIQALWRGVVARSLCDKLWLDKVVVPIQQMARKRVAGRFVKQVRKELNEAVLVIQKKVRSRISCKRLTNKLINRENEYRLDSITMTTTEEEYFGEKIAKMVSRLLRKDYKAKAEEWDLAYQQGLADVYNLENDVVEMYRQREILSPRAIVQGYYQELNKNCIELRDRATEMKKDVIFHKLLHHLNADAQFEHQIKAVEEVAAVRERLNIFRNDENAERLERSQQRDLFERTLNKRQAIAAERRRWTVQFCTRNGKPDKKRRPGRPWDPSIVAGPEKQVYSGTHADIFAEMNAKDLKPGETGSVDQTINRLTLQTYLEEVNAYEQILLPITTVLQNSFGGRTGSVQPEELGFGEEGKKIAPALWGIGLFLALDLAFILQLAWLTFPRTPPTHTHTQAPYHSPGRGLCPRAAPRP